MTATTPPHDPAPLNQVDFDFIRALVRRESAIVLDDGKRYLVTSRLHSIARGSGFGSVSELISRLQTTPFGDLHIEAVEAIATTETSFYRDLYPFASLRDHIIPEFIMQRQETSRTLNIWSAACSSGQEPYSVAMTLLDRFPHLLEWNLQLFASDISQKMIERAQAGVYSQLEVNRGLPAPYLVRFFTQQDGMWHIKEEPRRMVRFFRQNIAASWGSLPPIDILLLRNILIYFDLATRRDVLRQVRRVLHPDGFLVLGSAETTLNLDEMFTRVQIGRSVFYKVSKGGVR